MKKYDSKCPICRPFYCDCYKEDDWPRQITEDYVFMVLHSDDRNLFLERAKIRWGESVAKEMMEKYPPGNEKIKIVPIETYDVPWDMRAYLMPSRARTVTSFGSVSSDEAFKVVAEKNERVGSISVGSRRSGSQTRAILKEVNDEMFKRYKNKDKKFSFCMPTFVESNKNCIDEELGKRSLEQYQRMVNTRRKNSVPVVCDEDSDDDCEDLFAGMPDVVGPKVVFALNKVEIYAKARDKVAAFLKKMGDLALKEEQNFLRILRSSEAIEKESDMLVVVTCNEENTRHVVNNVILCDNGDGFETIPGFARFISTRQRGIRGYEDYISAFSLERGYKFSLYEQLYGVSDYMEYSACVKIRRKNLSKNISVSLSDIENLLWYSNGSRTLLKMINRVRSCYIRLSEYDVFDIGEAPGLESSDRDITYHECAVTKDSKGNAHLFSSQEKELICDIRIMYSVKSYSRQWEPGGSAMKEMLGVVLCPEFLWHNLTKGSWCIIESAGVCEGTRNIVYSGSRCVRQFDTCLVKDFET